MYLANIKKILPTLKSAVSNTGITVLTDNEHMVFDPRYLFDWIQYRDNQLLPFLKSKGYTIVNYDFRADIESGSYSDWALLNSDNNLVLCDVCDYSEYGYKKICAFAVKHLDYTPAAK